MTTARVITRGRLMSGKAEHQGGDLHYGYIVIPPKPSFTGHFIYERAMRSALDLQEQDGEGEEVWAVHVKLVRKMRRPKRRS